MRIHYVQHVPFEGLGYIEAWASGGGHGIGVTRLYAEESLPRPDAADLLIIMGGPMNIYEEERYPWLAAEKRWIREAVELDRKVLGICLGGQLIADALGGTVTRNPCKEIGWFPVQLTEEAADSKLFGDFPAAFTPLHWHGDTFSLPPGSIRIAKSEGCANQAFAYRERVIGLQFHLESTPQSARLLVENCGEELTEGTYIASADEIRSAPSRFRQANRLMAHLLDRLSSR